MAAGEGVEDLLEARMLVVAAQDQDCGPVHGLDGLHGGVGVGALAVVDVADAGALADELDPMLHALKGAQRLPDDLRVDPLGQGQQRAEHGVFQIVAAGDIDLLPIHEGRVLPRPAEHDRVPVHVHALGDLSLAGEEEDVGRGQLFKVADDGIVIVEHGEIVPGLVVEDLGLGGDVLLHGAEAVDVIRGDVAHACGLGVEADVPLQLQRRGLRHDHVPGLGLHGIGGDGHADVPQHEGLSTGGLEDLAGEGGAGGLAVGAGDADEVRLGVPVAQLDLGDHLDAPPLGLHDEGAEERDDGAGDQQIHPVQQVHGIVPEPDLVGDAGKSVEEALDLRLHVVDDDPIPVLVQEPGSGDAALGHAYDERRLLLCHSSLTSLTL